MKIDQCNISSTYVVYGRAKDDGENLLRIFSASGHGEAEQKFEQEIRKEDPDTEVIILENNPIDVLLQHCLSAGGSTEGQTLYVGFGTYVDQEDDISLEGEDEDETYHFILAAAESEADALFEEWLNEEAGDQRGVVEAIVEAEVLG